MNVYLRVTKDNGLMAWWHLVNVDMPTYQAFLDTTRGKGMTVVECRIEEWNAAPKNRKHEHVYQES